MPRVSRWGCAAPTTRRPACPPHIRQGWAATWILGPQVPIKAKYEIWGIPCRLNTACGATKGVTRNPNPNALPRLAAPLVDIEKVRSAWRWLGLGLRV